MNELTASIQSYLTTAPTSAFSGRPVSVSAPWEGRDNLLWRATSAGDEVVVKLFLDAGQVRSRRQYDGQQMFATSGLAPQPLWYDRQPEGLDRQVLVYRWAPGSSLQLDTATLPAVAQALAAVHGADGAEMRRFSPHPLNLAYLWRLLQSSLAQGQAWLSALPAAALAADLAQLGAAAASLIDAALPLWQSAPVSPIHGDAKLENMVNSFGTVVLLDWEFFGLGDPAQEAAGFLHTQRGELSPTDQQHWLDHYLAEMDQPGLAARIGVYQRILPLRDLCFLLDGLRELTQERTTPTTEPDTLPFLAATLTATLEQAATTLTIDRPQMHDHVAELFARMLVQQ